MKKIFFFDVETTGTSKATDAIIQLGAVFGSLDEETKEFHEEMIISQYINTDTKIGRWAQMVHGITNADLAGYGYMDEYIHHFLQYVNAADMLVGHNVQFDIGMLTAECERLGIAMDIPEHKSFCTMKTTREICQIPYKKRAGYKNPKLGELHQYLFSCTFDKAHDALADIQATKNCFLELYKRGDIEPFMSRD